jgi:hypothetical protein
MFETQKEVLKTCDEVGCAWIERVKPEVGLWPELATKLSASRTMPAGLQACQNTFAQRRQMVADDGRHLFDDGQKIIASMSRTMSNGCPKDNSRGTKPYGFACAAFVRLFPLAMKNNDGVRFLWSDNDSSMKR